MSWFLVILFLILKFSTNLSEATNHHDDNRNILSSAFVVGTVYCDTCLQQTFTKESHFISGASIGVECKVKNSKSRFYTEVKTNEHGEFKVKLPFLLKKHKKRIKGCTFKLLSSSEPHCAIASTTTSTNSLSLKKKIQQEHIFSAGVFSFQPIKKPNFCDQKHHSTIPNSKEHVFKEHKHSIANFKEHVYVKHSTQSSKKSHFSDEKDFSIFPPLIPNPFQPPPLIPNPFQPPPMIPNPFQPPSPPFIPNPFQPPSPPPFLPNPFQPPPSSPPPLIPNPFQPPPSSPPPIFPFPPLIPSLTPSPPPPPPPKSIFPPFPPLFPPPLSPGSPPTSSKHSSP